MNALRKDFVREIQHSLSRFLSILILVSLAVAFLSGLRSTAPDMKNTLDSYMDQQSFMDIQILGTLGITQEDIAVLRAQPGVAEVEPAHTIDVYAHAGGVDVVTKLHSLPKKLNRLTVMEGRLPGSTTECVVDQQLLNRMGLSIGDQLEFQVSGPFQGALAVTAFTVTGVVRSPLYISPERGTSTLGTGQAAAFAYVLPEAFDMEAVTTAYLTVEGAADEMTFSPAYTDTVDAVLHQLEPVSRERSKLRRESLVDAGNEKLADAEAELEAAKADAAGKLDHARKQLRDARKQLDGGWAELNQGRAQLKTETAHAKQQIADAKEELADARRRLEDGEVQYHSGMQEFQDGQQSYLSGLSAYEKNEKLLHDARTQYEDGLDEYLNGKDKLNRAHRQLTQGEREYEAGEYQFDHSLDGLLPPEIGITNASDLLDALNGESSTGPLHTKINETLAAAKAAGLLLYAKADELDRREAEVVRLKAEISALEQQLQDLDSAQANHGTLSEGQPDTNLPDLQPPPISPPPDPPKPAQPDRALLEAEWNLKRQALVHAQAQIAAIQQETGMQTASQMRAAAQQLSQLPLSASDIQAQLAIGKSTLTQARAQLDEGWAEYRDGKAELDAAKRQLDDAQEQLLDGEAELKDGKRQLDDAKAQLDRANAQLITSRQELDTGWQQYRQGQIDLADGETELAAQTQQATADMDAAQAQLKAGERDYAAGYAEYNSAKADAEAQIADAEYQLGDARRKIADIGDSQWYILNRNANPGYLGFGQDADRMANLASVFPVLFFLVAALVCLTTMTRMVEEQRVQIGCLKALGYSRWAISRKYLGYGFLPSLLGAILGLVIGFTLFPKMIFTAYQMMYDVPNIQLSVYPGISAVSLLAAVGCTAVSSVTACMNALRETPAALLRPRAPKAGKRVLLEYIKPLWKRMSFNHKVTARNLLRYQKRFWMTVIGIGGCTALIIAGFGLRSSLLTTMSVQYNEIFQYTAQVAVSENLLDAERSDIESYIASNPDILDTLSCRIGTVSAESHTYTTSAYMEVVDPARINAFVHLQTYRSRQSLTVPDDGVVIDQKLSELLGLKVGDTFTIDGEGRVEVRVAAINENYLGHFIYLSPTYYERVFGKAVLNNAYLMTFTSSDGDLCDGIFTDLMNLHGVVAASRMLSTRDTYMSAMERIDFVVVIVILSAAALALVVLYNLSNINITERRRELATIRVLGFYDWEVSAYVNRENLVLTLLGILFGIGAGRLLHMWLVRSVEIDLMMFGRETDPMAYLWASLLTAVFSAAVAWMSHQKMKRIDMVESLKSAE